MEAVGRTLTVSVKGKEVLWGEHSFLKTGRLKENTLLISAEEKEPCSN